MSVLIALAVSIGGLAIAATWLFVVPLAFLGVQIWQGFVAWASFYHSGGKTAGLKNTVVCMTYGVIVGALSILLAGQLGMLGAFAAPVAVGIGAAVLVLGAHVGLLATIPASVYGFACVAGLILLKGLTPIDALVPTIASVVLGAIFGWASEYVGGLLTKKETAK
ncbi:MAG: hypothetical protein A2Z99_06255 [Treponema sp. GWB1_62_6]|nr:MAG: hypothetical protein A2001_03105 [Treponema sp. GWC1_61_84]OHE64642.1 MAG: hypothetical protein A2Z99_06255 [Treponema sp. GWB1_62_6]HCM25133.1 DUF1097 domain-containing protein [Treponema sp.]